MNKMKKQILNILIGLGLSVLIVILLPKSFSMQARIALGTIILMVFWWITIPVHLAVTALIPLIINSFYEMIPMSDMLDDYASPIVLLILGAGILTSAWTLHGLDKRVAVKSLAIIGPSVWKQIVMWFAISVLMSAFMPNMVVVSALCPIAYSMIKHSGTSVQSKESYLIMIAIAWGAGIGGFGTPMGGAMNLVAISNIEKYSGTEFFYWQWFLNMLPYLIILSTITLAFILLIKKDKKIFPGSKEFYKGQLPVIGRISSAEIISLLLLGFAVVLSFTRPLYEKILPGFQPPYAFLLAGAATFFIKSKDGIHIMEWKHAASNINWGLIILFAGGMAAGGLIIDTGAANVLAGMIPGKESTFILVLIIVAVGMFLANTSSNTAACAVLVPIVISVTADKGINPLPYVFLTAAACNSAFALPTSIRAVPVGYGLDTGFMFRKGMGAIAVVYAVLSLTGYAIISILG